MEVFKPTPKAGKTAFIRRADWRFLLPDPRPKRTCCLADPDLTEAAAWISGRLVGPGETCDLVVLSDPDTRTLSQAWEALRPGGACYCEWNRPVPGIRRRLEPAGFTRVQCYVPWPRQAGRTTLFRLPLDDSQVFLHFLANREADSTLRTQSRRLVLSVLWQLAHRGSLLYPVCSVARKPGFMGRLAEEQADVDPAGKDLLANLLTEWDAQNLGPKPGRLDWVLITAGHQPVGKVVGMIFADGERTPRLVVKLPRVDESIQPLIQEAKILQAVQMRAGVAGEVPRFLFMKEWNGVPVLGESASSGLPLYRVLNWKNARRLAFQATQWLADLAGKSPPKPKAEWWNRLVEPVLAEFEHDFQAVIKTGMLEAARARLEALPDLPMVIEQRDFSPWNVLIDSNGALVVLDWESGEAEGLPGMDLVYFLTHLAFFLDRTMPPGNYLASYRRLFDPASPTGQLALECTSCYTSQTGLPKESLPALRLLAWMKHALNEYNLMATGSGGRPEVDTLRNSMFFSLCNEELKHLPD